MPRRILAKPEYAALTLGGTLLQTRNGRVRNVVGPCDFDNGLATGTAFQRLAPLVRGQFGFATEDDAAGLGAGAPFAGPGVDKLSFKFRQATKYRQH
jgi:hypothetical protein